MLTPFSQTSIAEIAAQIRTRRDINSSTVLVLGTRAGGLFNNAKLYDQVKNLVFTPFDTLSDTEKFQECYRVLSEERFNASNIDDILRVSLLLLLKSDKCRPEDTCMAELIYRGFFDVVISTNIDPLLDNALQREVLLRESRELQHRIVIQGVHRTEDLVRNEKRSCKILKIFGDLESRRYNTAGIEFQLDADRQLREYLAEVLAENMLVIGYDPVWDRPLERAFPERGGDFVCINEEPPEENSLIARAIQKRRGKYLPGSFKRFVTKLDELLLPGKESSPTYQFNQPQTVLAPKSEQVAEQLQKMRDTPLSSSTLEKGKRQKVFISYSENDAQYWEQLKTHLKWHIQQKLIDTWDRTQIEPGADQRKEIKKALEEARVAVLLVSANYLASEVMGEELPVLLEAAQAGNIKILSVILSTCGYNETPLRQFRPVNTKTLLSMKKDEREEIWTQVVRLVTQA